MNILIINGPNLNLTGKREPGHYGSTSFQDYLAILKEVYSDMRLTCFQSNIEGELIDEIQKADGLYDGVILNAGGYTHTSVAIGDAIGAVDVPVVEVHISNIFDRESFRQLSHISAKCVGSISGFGLGSYLLAIEALKHRSENRFFPRT